MGLTACAWEWLLIWILCINYGNIYLCNYETKTTTNTTTTDNKSLLNYKLGCNIEHKKMR